MSAAVVAGPRTLARRLLPLQIGVALQGLILWVPIEKLFMTEIGFDAASGGGDGCCVCRCGAATGSALGDPG